MRFGCGVGVDAQMNAFAYGHWRKFGVNQFVSLQFVSFNN